MRITQKREKKVVETIGKDGETKARGRRKSRGERRKGKNKKVKKTVRGTERREDTTKERVVEEV